MIKTSLVCALIFFSTILFAQENKLYHPEADAVKDIEAVVKKAKQENKYVLIMVGGNWCKWCLEFARFTKSEQQLDSVINSAFVWYHLNYSKENENKKVLAYYGFPQRFGFPVFVILNQQGERIHTQNSEYLEDGKDSYDKNKVQAFLEMWSPRALNPKMYGE